MTQTEIVTKFDYTGLSPETRVSLKSRAEKIGERNRRIASDIWENGRDLHEAQQELAVHGYGRFQEWVENETPYSLRTAYRFIDVYQQFDYAKLAQSNIATSALYLVAAASTPEEARQEIIEAAQQGQTITYSQAKETIQGSKPIMPDQMRPHVQSFIINYKDHLGRSWSDLDNPAHTNSVFWGDITRHFKAHNIPYAPAGLKFIIKQLHAAAEPETPEPKTLEQAKAENLAECVQKWVAWLKAQPGPKKPYLDQMYRYVSEWDPHKHYNSATLNQARDIIEAQLQANPTGPDAKYAPIHELQSLLPAWLTYATGGRNRQEHYDWMLECKQEGKSGELFDDLTGWLDSRTVYRKNDAWQATQNHTEDLRQQLQQKAEYTQEDLHRDLGVAESSPRESSPTESEPLGPADTAPSGAAPGDPDPRIQQIRTIRRQIEEMMLQAKNIDDGQTDSQLFFALNRACLALDAAAAILKNS